MKKVFNSKKTSIFIKELKKTYIRLLLLIIVFAVLSFILLFYIIQKQIQSTIYQKETRERILAIEAQKKDQRFPVRLTIPAININATIQLLGVTQTGEMEVPSNTVDVGWFKLGPHPGEKGSAVIAGHFNGENGEAGVFADLYKLKGGDKLFIKDNKGASITFVVRESRIYNPGYADDVFSSSDGAHLNLVTCDGVWDGVKKSYNKRLVVFTDAIQ